MIIGAEPLEDLACLSGVIDPVGSDPDVENARERHEHGARGRTCRHAEFRNVSAPRKREDLGGERRWRNKRT